MKKWLIGLSVIFLLLLAGDYIFIPARLRISKIMPLNCNPNGAFKFLAEDSNWAKWGTGKERGYYRVTDRSPRIIGLAISNQDSVLNSRIVILPMTTIDSVTLLWECNLGVSLNPVARIRQYQEAKAIRADMKATLDNLRSFLEKKENIYGISISETSTNDSFLVATHSTYPAYPATTDIYSLLHKLKEYVARENARETGYPMVNVTVSDSGQYKTMVAIPVNKALHGDGDIYFRKLIPGKYLTTEIRGGIYAVNTALGQLQNYINDYRRTTMAIPFQSLITDRSRVTDTTQWLTRWYYPVM